MLIVVWRGEYCTREIVDEYDGLSPTSDYSGNPVF